MENIDLEFEDAALTAIAKKAIERKTGARGLRAIMEDVLDSIMFEAPSDKTLTRIVVTEESVKDHAVFVTEHNEGKEQVKLLLPAASKENHGKDGRRYPA